MNQRPVTRRTFLKQSALGLGVVAAGAPLAARAAPRIRTGRIVPADRKLNVAAIGCGGKGAYNVRAVGTTEQITALCDVDLRNGREHFRRWPDVPAYRDFRDMLREMDEQIDAVIISTPDHMHFPAAMRCIEVGKHVYVEKPLAHTVEEARLLTEAARRHGVVTTMGIQGHATEGPRLMREWVQAGVIGPVHEVHVWSNRPIWPQNCTRPAAAQIVPDEVDWNRWLGVARARPYHRDYMPFRWRGWWDFGCGALGDMGCHTLDASFWALDLGAPERIEAEAGPFTEESPPEWSIVTYHFPARGAMPPVKLVWYDGDKKPPRPEGLEEGRELGGSGQYLVGELGTIFEGGAYGASPRVIPEAKMQELAPHLPPKTIPRVPKGDPYLEWIGACKGGPLPGAAFDFSGPLTEMVLLGNVAIRAGKPIEWDAANLRCANAPDADRFITKSYRKF